MNNKNQWAWTDDVDLPNVECNEKYPYVKNKPIYISSTFAGLIIFEQSFYNSNMSGLADWKIK